MNSAVVFLATLTIAMTICLFLPERSHSRAAHIAAGGSFQLHERINLISLGPSGRVMPNGIQVSNLLWNYQLVMPPGSKFEDESVGVFSSTAGTILHVDGNVTTSLGILPGPKEIKLRLHGMTNSASPLGLAFEFQQDRGKIESPCTWIVCQFNVYNGSVGNQQKQKTKNEATNSMPGATYFK